MCPQDVESYDPVLNPVLNREVRRTGGRVLITLGDQDIDLSPSFVIFLSTRDPTVSREALRVQQGGGVGSQQPKRQRRLSCRPLRQVEFPPDLCSRVTFVNFTVTRSSLQSQCLNEVLKAERPDVDEKRSDLLKLQGTFPHLRLRERGRRGGRTAKGLAGFRVRQALRGACPGRGEGQFRGKRRPFRP